MHPTYIHKPHLLSFLAYGWDDDDDDDDPNRNDALLLDGSGSVLDTDAAARRRAVLEELWERLASISERKSTVQREALLRHTCWTLAGTPATEVELPSVVYEACRFAWKGGAAAEQYAACRVLAVTSIVLGADEDAWVTSVRSLLESSRMHTTTSTIAVRTAALRAYTTAVVVCGAADREVRDAWMDQCEEWGAVEYRNAITPAGVRAAAWDCWTVVATLLHDLEIAGEDDANTGRGVLVLEQLRDCLESNHPDLRSAAGQAASLIHEARLNLGTDEGNTTARRFHAGNWEGSSQEDTMYEIQQRIAELAVESSHRVSKKVKKAQRATFREYVATLVDEESPYEVVHLRRGSLEIHSWKELIMLNFMKQSLQGGFQTQLLTNGTLQSMLRVDASSLSRTGGMSGVEKRLVQSKASEASKLADQDLQGRRDKRENVKNHFLTADGERI